MSAHIHCCLAQATLYAEEFWRTISRNLHFHHSHFNRGKVTELRDGSTILEDTPMSWKKHVILNIAVFAFKCRLWGEIFRENRKLLSQECLVSTHYRWPPPFNSLTSGLQIFFPTPPLGPLLSFQVSLTIVPETTQSKAGFWIRHDRSQIQNTTSATTKLRFK